MVTDCILALTDNDIHVLWHVILPLIGFVACFAFLVCVINGAIEESHAEKQAVERIEDSLRYSIEQAQAQAHREERAVQLLYDATEVQLDRIEKGEND